MMLSLIIQYFQIFSGKIVTYCDNQAVVKKLQTGWRLWRYKNTKGTDCDLQTVLRQTLQMLRKEHDFRYTTEWIKGHQDDIVGEKTLSRPAILNIAMDNDTKAAYDLPEYWQPHQFVPVLPTEGCAIYIDNCKITSHIHQSLQDRWHENEARDYLFQRHKITTATFSTISWHFYAICIEEAESVPMGTCGKGDS